jgi:tetratricopeptide repeat protein
MNMALDTNPSNQLARRGNYGKRVNPRGAGWRDSAKSSEESVALLRELDEALLLARTVRHLGDVYHEEGRPDLAESRYLEALRLYRKRQDNSPLDLTNAARSLAVSRTIESTSGRSASSIQRHRNRSRNKRKHRSARRH